MLSESTMGDPEDPDFEDGDDDDIEEDLEDTVRMALGGDNVGDLSVEVNVEELVSDIEASQGSGPGAAAARRRLEELMEEKRIRRMLEDLDDYDFDFED